jgi:ABC-type multidrug transport system fused ATPase/permease subunit
MSLVSKHLRRHRGRLALSYSLAVVENVFELLYPFAIGLAVDGLLDDRWGGVGVLVAITVAHIVVSAVRQLVDTRTFNRLYADMATSLVSASSSWSGTSPQRSPLRSPCSGRCSCCSCTTRSCSWSLH